MKAIYIKFHVLEKETKVESAVKWQYFPAKLCRYDFIELITIRFHIFFAQVDARRYRPFLDI